jgi:peptidyl-prolyl cis-trans isomerase B (cyclophilin B)
MKKVRLHTNHGDIVIALDDENSPATVANFLQYVNDRHYDNTIFHRVIDGFMVQGGGFSPGCSRSRRARRSRTRAMNGLKNAKYTVAMARTGDPHSATAQFFINVGDNAFLDFKSPGGNGWGYTVFGKVVEGRTSSTRSRAWRPRAAATTRTCPTSDVVIKSAEVVG